MGNPLPVPMEGYNAIPHVFPKPVYKAVIDNGIIFVENPAHIKALYNNVSNLCNDHC